MFSAMLIAIGAGFAHGAALSAASSELEGLAFGLGVLAIVVAVASLPLELAKVLNNRDQS